MLSLWGEGVGRAAIVVCYGLGQSTLRERTVAVAGCHCRVPLECGMVDGGIFLPDSDSYRGFTSNRGGRATNHFGGWTWHQGAIVRGAIAVPS